MQHRIRRIKTLDKVLAYVLIVLGAMQCAATFYFFRRVEEPAYWFFAGGMLSALVGALALLRVKYGAVAAGVRRVSLAASVLLGVFWLAMACGLPTKFSRYPAAYTGVVVAVASAAVARAASARGGRS